MEKKKKKQVNFSLTVEDDKLYFWTFNEDSVSAKIDITPVFNFLKEFFAWKITGQETLTK